MSLLWLTGVLYLLTWSGSVALQLLFANRRDIRMMDASKPRQNSTVVIGHLEDATALDFFYEEHAIFWADITLEMIKMAYMNGSAEINVITNGLSSPECLACDWLGHKLYWTDSDTNRIEVSQFDGRYRKVLFWQDLDQLRAIALAPMDGLMFWTDWGEMPKIERASMDGNHSSRVIIVNNSVSWPNAISIDYQTRRIYWSDSRLQHISSVDYNGHNRRLVLSDGGLEHPFALAVFQNVVYWTDLKTRSINMFNQTSKFRRSLGSNSLLNPMGIHTYVADRQPKQLTPCDTQNGGCSHLCLLSSLAPGFTCACPTGVKLKDHQTCYDGVQEMLLLARRTDLRRISLDTLDYTDVVLPVQEVKHAVAIDYDPVEGYVYWSDDEVRQIRRAFLNGSNQENLVVTEVYHPDGVAIDWIARNLYWTDTGTDRIEVARINGTSRKVLINQNLDEPRAIVLHPVAGYMFWSDWGKFPKIERAALDGTERITIVDTDLHWPNGLTVDYATNKVYWGDGYTDKIELCNLDGSDRRQLVSDNLPHIFGFSLLGDFVYWTDWQRRSIERVHKTTGTNREVIIEQLPDLMGLKAVEVNKVWGVNPCAVNNGGCSHLCLHRPNQTVCSCPMGMELESNQKTCIVPEAFLLFARRSDIRRISLETHHNNVIIPVSGIKDATALDFDINDNRIYWTDTGQKSICRAFMNGSNLDYVIDFGLECPEGVAVDWIAHNIYWVDMCSKRIEVARLDGSSRKVLLWKDLTPHALALNPNHGYMYWSDWSQPNFFVGRAAMDGSGQQVLVKTAGRPAGLTLDYDDSRLYWVDKDSGWIESSDLQGKDRMRVFNNRLPSPYGITQYQDFIYWTDLTERTIERANKTSGENRTKIECQVDSVVDILVFHASRQSGWNPCFVNNGGCSHLCLAVPSGNNNSVFNHSCSCPTHYKLAADNKTCEAPRTFLLLSQRNQISRLLPDSSEAPDIILPIHQLKHVRGIEYDPLDQYLYWIDGRTSTIKRGYENGTGVISVIPSPNVFNPYDLALDIFSRHLYWSCEKRNVINVTRLDLSAVGVVIGESLTGQEERPRSIALHPWKGLMFWVNMLKSPTIERAAMDGIKRVSLFSTGLTHPNALTLDFEHEMLYWSDEKMRQVESAKMDGANRRVLLHLDQVTPIALAIFGPHLYWITREDVLMRADKLSCAHQEQVLDRVSQLSDLIAVNGSQLTPLSHLCSENNGGCSHLCILEPVVDGGGTDSTRVTQRCSCPVDLMLMPDEQKCGDPPTCNPDQFTCENSKMQCIPKVWRCDGQPDCEDTSDEMNCPNCGKNQFRCRNGECVDREYLCDRKQHCADHSDEDHCCKRDEEFMCVSNHECIRASLVCNEHEDCPDGSDEKQPACHVGVQLTNENVVSKQTPYTIGIVVPIIVVVVGFAVYLYCRCRSRATTEQEECADTMLVTKPLTTVAPSILARGAGQPLLRGVCNGLSVTDGAGNGGQFVPTAPAYVELYERSHVTGASSSSSNLTARYPETLNPPPSPVTDKSQYSAAYYCPSHLSVMIPPPPPHHHHHHHQSYRHYRTRNRPPPPTPCSTDVYDDSEPYPCRYDYSSCATEVGYTSDPYPPPPTPRSHYLSDDNCDSCPPSPFTERSYCNPYPPPPSPEG